AERWLQHYPADTSHYSACLWKLLIKDFDHNKPHNIRTFESLMHIGIRFSGDAWREQWSRAWQSTNQSLDFRSWLVRLGQEWLQTKQAPTGRWYLVWLAIRKQENDKSVSPQMFQSAIDCLRLCPSHSTGWTRVWKPLFDEVTDHPRRRMILSVAAESGITHEA